jgi:hypothetical protein
MRMTAFRRHITAWLGALAIGLTPLAPMISWAKSIDSGVPSDLCSGAHIQLGSAPDQSPSAPSPAHQPDDCACCIGAPGHVALASSALRITASSGSSRAAFRSDAPLLAATTLLRQRPRGPPALL